MKQGSDLLKRIKKYRICYAMMLPFIVVFFVFTVFPVIASVILSFSRYNVFEAPVFIGLTNYTNLFFADDIFSTAMKNTVIFGLITGPVGYFMCFFLSWMINELPHRARSLFTLAFYLPSIAGNVFAIWLIVFDGDIRGIRATPCIATASTSAHGLTSSVSVNSQDPLSCWPWRNKAASSVRFLWVASAMVRCAAESSAIGWRSNTPAAVLRRFLWHC